MLVQKLEKGRMSELGLLLALVPGIIFTVMATGDLSMDLMVYHHKPQAWDFVIDHLVWRAEAPYFVSCPLPLPLMPLPLPLSLIYLTPLFFPLL